MNNAATKTAKCGKCDGRGVLPYLARVDNGKCYACNGAGCVTEVSTTERNRQRMAAGHTVDALAEAGDHVLESNPAWAVSMIERAARHMLAMQDTGSARIMLHALPTRLRAAVIAKGRELKGAA